MHILIEVHKFRLLQSFGNVFATD